ncbi:Beta-galactosidase [Cellulomonas sp. T2.31MG-18]|uniref:glycoside hydrolase family 2 protein n=1 Tax=Cellulomonas sp. T2.31MG-18 TaxID=3157619 RepID=UPI0035EC33AB
MRRTLHEGWTLRPAGGDAPAHVAEAGAVPATVPGTVHTDLLAAGLIPDPYLDANERLLAWIGNADWRYETRFTWVPGDEDRVDLLFEGLETVARVELNGRTLGATANMHRTYRFDVADALRAGDNVLTVTFSSAVRHADAASLELGARPHTNDHPYNAIRTMACSFGWDWGPELVTAGIWRPVGLHAWRVARLSSVRPVVDVDGTTGTVRLHVDVERAGQPGALTVTAEVAGRAAVLHLDPAETSGVVELRVEDVARWWPRGHGDQPLYDLAVTLRGDETDGEPLDAWKRRIGFRTVRVDTEPDAAGTPFRFVVNDRPVLVKGANWIPDDAFPHRVGADRYAQRLAQAEEAGFNLVRVWGGGVFEQDAFYDECDRRGLMVWQDFLFACAAYSEEEPLRSEVAAEVEDNVRRLMPHPSLVLWNGGNENLWGFADWGWQPRLDGRSWGLGYYTDLLPGIVAALDPGRPYSAGSPWSVHPDLHPNDPRHGTTHIWDVWNEVDYTTYLAYRPRFVAEFGWQGPPTWSTLRRAVSDEPLTPESPGMLAHQKAAKGNDKLTAGLVPHLRVPDDMDDWHWAMSLNQARAVQLGVEHFRALAPHCSGSIVWQLNDCWPVTSWAAVDGDGRRKPVFYALVHANADRLVTVQPEGDGLVAALVNDADEAWAGALSARRQTLAGQVLESEEVTVLVQPRSVATVPLPPAVVIPDEPSQEVLVVEVGARRALWFYVEDRDSVLTLPAFDASVTATGTGHRVEVTATSTVRDLALLVDKVDPGATVDDMLVTLLPGETVSWHVTGTGDDAAARLLDPSVLRCANQLVVGAR